MTQHRVRQVTGGLPSGPDLPSALYANSPATILPQAYRGWLAFGYKANDPATANAPVVITGADLTLSGLAGIDPAQYRAAVDQIIANGGDPSSIIAQFDLKVVPYYPNHILQRLDGPDPELWASATDLSTSRRGKNFIGSGSVDRFAGARAVPLLSTSDEFSIAGSITGGPISGSASKSDTVAKALLDFKDLNGDQFPDVVANGLSVQFSPAIGGLEGESQGVGASGAAQQTQGTGFTVGIGGNFSHQRQNASSGIDTRFGLSSAGDTSQQMASIGFSANMSQGESDVDYDLFDMNGDGLPDRVSKSGALTVQLNVGYGFLAEEQWGTGSINEGESRGDSQGLSIGFNDGIYGFGGGVNQSDHTSESIESLQDVNGDGLVDRVRQGGAGIRSAIKNGDRTFLYDLNGNQAGWDADRTGQKRRIVWDEENRIQTITDGPTSEYKYDEDTNRVIKRRPQGETFYVNPFYVDAAGKNSKHVFAGTTRITTKLEMPSNGGGGFEKFQYFYHPDHLGSTSYVTDQLGQVDQHYETFPFGEAWIEEATGQADKVTPYRFTGKEWDSETQLHYFGARYYDPRTSLWQNPDPILGAYLSSTRSGGLQQPANFALYAYVHQRPLVAVDPDGNACQAKDGTWSTACASARDGFWDRHYVAAEILGNGIAVFNYREGNFYNPLSGNRLTPTEREDALVGLVTLGVPVSRAGPPMSALAQKISDVTGKAASKVATLFRRTGCSFDGATLVRTKGGLKRIDQIDVNELVLAKNLQTEEEEWKQVQDRYLNLYDETVTIELSTGAAPEKIVSNTIHPVHVQGKGWIKISSVKPGDQLLR